jgi:hypothetical protein
VRDGVYPPANVSAPSPRHKATFGTGAKDLMGNALDQERTKTGNQGKTWTFTVRRIWATDRPKTSERRQTPVFSPRRFSNFTGSRGASSPRSSLRLLGQQSFDFSVILVCSKPRRRRFSNE